MPICGSCDYRVHHYGHRRHTKSGQPCSCICVTQKPKDDMKAPSKKKPVRVIDPHQPKELFAEENCLSKDVRQAREQISLLWDAVKALPPPAPQHQCTISADFVSTILTQIKQLELRLDAMLVTQADKEARIIPLAELERRAILEALTMCHGHVGFAARSLGIGAATLYRKVQSYGVTMKKIRDKSTSALQDQAEVSPTTLDPAE